VEMLDALAQTFDHTTKVIAGIGPDQLDGATPCREWTVRDLLAHTTGVVVNMGRGATGEPLLADINGVQLDEDLETQFRTVSDRTLAAWTTRGLDGELDIGAGPMPPVAGISINLLDTATHSWDLARATGQDGVLPDELAGFVLGIARGFITDEIRSFAGFDPAVEVGEGSDSTVQLVAFLGRQP
jgi:uncharacterized protein (TIGR03086 family)